MEVGNVAIVGGSLVLIIMAVVTVVVAVSTQQLKVLLGTSLDQLKLSPQWPLILSMAKTAVRFAEQMKLNDVIDKEGKVVKAAAIKALQDFLNTQGWGDSVDLVAIDALIEAAYNELKVEFEEHVPEIDWSTVATPLKQYTFSPQAVMGNTTDQAAKDAPVTTTSSAVYATPFYKDTSEPEVKPV